MPKNNSTGRKEKRRVKAKERQSISDPHTCGHQHISAKQAKRCKAPFGSYNLNPEG